MRDGYVYVVQATQLGWIKIGWAKDVARRMSAVAAECGSSLSLLGCMSGTQREERDVLSRFAPYRIAFDWFIPSADVLVFAQSLPSPVRVSFVRTTTGCSEDLYRRLRSASRAQSGPHLGVVPQVEALPTAGLGARIQQARERRGMRLADLDRAAELRAGHSGFIERGEREHPSIETVRKIASVLGVSIDWLATGAPPLSTS